MKRWQDRGEVLDSDDEELSLGTESQERASKRPRLEDEGRNVDGGGGVPQLTRNTPEQHGWQDEARHEIFKKPLDDHGQSVDEHITESPPVSQKIPTNQALYTSSALSSSRSESSEGLPDIRDVLAGTSGKRSVFVHVNDAGVATASSSPLSEREISPPPPTTFQFPKLNPQAAQADLAEHSDGDELGPEHLQEGPMSVFAGRRSLRARNEKQLHPYLFEKAQHQRQFRERGMKPIAYTAERREAETQDASLSRDDSDQSFQGEQGSRLRPSSELGDNATSNANRYDTSNDSRLGPYSSDGELPELSTLLRRSGSDSAQHAFKRRKLAHPARVVKSVVIPRLDPMNSRTQDEFSIPPSPPPTSSNSASRASSRPAVPGFRMPRGLSPKPLPTPQISSDVPGELLNPDNDSESEAERLLPASRPSTIPRRLPHPIAIESSDESSAGESEAVVEDRRLQRERKRIKGVLPASWLKIDLRAQQKPLSPSPSRRRRQSSPSPIRTAPQKGVAQRVQFRRAASPNEKYVIAISDDESDDEGASRSPGPAEMRQLHLELRVDRAMTDLNSLVDDERMEMDYVDRMLAGSSRPRSGPTTRRKRQPKITESFRLGPDTGVDFSEERRASQLAIGQSVGRPKRQTAQQARREPKRRRTTHLSVVDAPRHSTTSADKLPQFLRLAVRRARKQADRGRHSPSSKHIRLATREDTEDAISVLRLWREGTIVPCQISDPLNRGVVNLAGDGADTGETSDTVQTSRVPLAEIHSNQQQRLPLPTRTSSGGRAPKSRPAVVARLPKMRQAQLRPIVQPQQADTEQHVLSQDNNPPPAAQNAAQPTRKRLSMLKQPIRYREAQMESLEGEFSRNHRAVMFEQRMHALTEDVVRSQRQPIANFHLNRFLWDGSQTPSSKADTRNKAKETTSNHGHPANNTSSPKVTLVHRPRKRQAHRLDAEAREYRQPSEPLPATAEPAPSTYDPVASERPVILGLGPFGTRYATDFDVLPLSLGTYFHESSFIGSGDFAVSLNLAGRNLDTATGRISIHLDGDILEWGAWTEDVAAGLSQVPRAVSDALQSLDTGEENSHHPDTLTLVTRNVDYLLRSTVRYFTRCLAFLDPVDRRHCIHCIQRLVEGLLEIIAEHECRSGSVGDVLARGLQYALVLSRQALTLCDNPLVHVSDKTRCQELLTRAANHLARDVFPEGAQALRSFYEDNRHARKREAGIHDTDAAICSVLVLRYTMQDLGFGHGAFWRIIYQVYRLDVAKLNTVSAFDKIWYDILTLQPALELDPKGILEPGSRFNDEKEDWGLPRQLIERLFELYPSIISIHGSRVNEYVRATLTRCSYLANRWGWWRCEPILRTIFDFFARRGLRQLDHEESRGSPRFLEQLNSQPSLEIQAEDRSFHIFLKMLSSALQGMQKHGIYPSKKIGAIAWRFIPNHGRTYRKDAEVRQDDLDALRNHHDLLCTLYYASSPDHRIRVDLIQNLVDHAASHREACRLGIRSWSNLASFQASSDEPTQRLESFTAWYRDMLATTIDQYRLARIEVEQEVASAKVRGMAEISSSLIEDIVSRNQRSIAATIVDLLAALKRALASCSSFENAICLLQGSTFWRAHDLFDPAARRLYGALNESLDVVTTALDVAARFRPRDESQKDSDDSQDYGDLSALQQLASAQAVSSNSDRNLMTVLHEPLAHLISNVFGADAVADDSLLIKVIDVWTRIAQSTVRNGDRSWTSYISDYGSESWFQLRDTEQMRRYTPYFLSRVVEVGHIDPIETGILTSWLKSLLEREAMLKFQHILTTSLLNHHSNEPLLDNLPFSRHPRGQYDVSLHELRQRRLALISSVLCNVREAFDQSLIDRPGSVLGTRQTCGDLLRQLMQTMRSNYQELQVSRDTAVADSRAQGAYVAFVQQIVSFLQQYTTDICPVDKFFTDSAAFPLPATDPMYVVGRLRSYLPKLNESRKRKELAVFIQTVSERAAVDGQQTYLVDQMVAAMADAVEHGNPQAPSLRHLLCTAVFPAYIANALLTASSWIVAVPMLEACSRTADKLLYSTKFEESNSIAAVASTIGCLLQSAVHPVNAALAHPGRLSLPHVQATLSAVFDFATTTLSCARHLSKIKQDISCVANYVSAFDHYATSIDAYLEGTDVDETLDSISMDTELDCPWAETRDFVNKQVQEKLTRDWHAQDGQYYVQRGSHSIEIVVKLGDEEKGVLLQAVRRFRESYAAIFVGDSKTRHTVNGVSAADVFL